MTTLPAHVDHSALWYDWLSGARSIIDIAIDHQIPLDALVAWANSPGTRAFTDALHTLATQRAEDINALAAAGAIAALARQTTAPNPQTPLEARIIESRRKAASALISSRKARAAEPPRSDAHRAPDHAQPHDAAWPTPATRAAPEKAPSPPATSRRASAAPPTAETPSTTRATPRKRTAADVRTRAGAAPALPQPQPRAPG